MIKKYNELKSEFPHCNIDSIIRNLNIKMKYVCLDGETAQAFQIDDEFYILIDEDFNNVADSVALDFTKLHELGHILLHSDFLSTPLNFKSAFGNKKEREANNFALKELNFFYENKINEETLKLYLEENFNIHI